MKLGEQLRIWIKLTGELINLYLDIHFASDN
jgi:hypothetical protein